MIRLVTQFDPPSARPAAATPSCCSCSCCSCCIVTIGAASIYSAVSAQRILHQTATEAPERKRWVDPFPGLVGFFALPVAVFLLIYGTGGTVEGLALPVSVGIWYGLVGLAYWGAGHHRPWLRAAGVVAATIAIGAFEFAIWYSAINSETG